MKSRSMLAAIYRGFHCLPKCLLKVGESAKGKLAIDCKSGRKLRHTQHVSCLNALHAEQRFFLKSYGPFSFQKHTINVLYADSFFPHTILSS